MNSDVLERVTHMAAALMKPNEIAILLGLDADKCSYLVKEKPNDPFTIAYQKGRLQTKLEIRKKTIKLAKAGSPQAELLADKYLNKD